MQSITTRTLNPLPFDNLEPKRFEDLARQLAYDFKPWRQLEATGRAGSDDGFDARGYEIVYGSSQPTLDEVEAAPDEGASDRLWLIQCKREKAIGPSKMRAYLRNIPHESRVDLYGLIIVAACDLSKTTRDVLRLWCADQGVTECHVWGKAELEDMLYQPKNDNLLFAYFGISLHMRRQKVGANIRRTIATKRKFSKIMDGGVYRDRAFILRDISDANYPFVDADDLEQSTRLWRVYYGNGLGINGLELMIRECGAYFDRETREWDMATGGHNKAIPRHDHNPWDYGPWHHDQAAHEFWLSIPENKRFTATMTVELPYSEVIEIDDVGDNFSSLPTIHVNFINGKPPLSVCARWRLRASKPYAQDVSPNFREDPHRRIFPEKFRNVEWENSWAARNEFKLASEVTEIELDPPEWLIERRTAIAREQGLPTRDQWD